jgi:hypothetical protein
VSASFIKELLRRATLIAAKEGGDLIVTDRHVNEALDELLVAGGDRTQGRNHRPAAMTKLLGNRARNPRWGSIVRGSEGVPGRQE